MLGVFTLVVLDLVLHLLLVFVIQGMQVLALFLDDLGHSTDDRTAAQSAVAVLTNGSVI